MDAFDADVLIYAATPGHPLGRRVRPLLQDAELARVGSTLLLPEILTKPTRESSADELTALLAVLSRLQLRPCDEATATLAVGLGSTYGLHAADAVHLATAVAAGADRFITNNVSDVTPAITELAVTYPQALPEPHG
ncbi:MAG: type II toxin-antitoxin system VapC family toxin [Solirubrobacteraceae bacterium]|jgi:predicted nucleic acid-binding protein